MPPPTSTVVAVTALVTAGVFLLAWLRQLRTRDATSVDLLWTLGIGATAGVHSALAGGWLPRRILVVGLVCTWAARLAWHLGGRLGAGEDGRYAELRRSAGARAGIVFLAVYLVQAALVVGLGLVFVPLTRAAEAGWRASDLLRPSCSPAPSSARARPTASCSAGAPSRPTAAARAGSACGASRATRTTSSSGCTGSPIRCSASACRRAGSCGSRRRGCSC